MKPFLVERFYDAPLSGAYYLIWRTTMSVKSNRLDQFFLDAETLITNAQNDASIAAVLSGFGYTSQKLADGLALYRHALDLYRVQKDEYSEQKAATEALNKAWDEANLSYTRTVKIARVAFKDNALAAGKLRLQGERHQTVAGWLEQAEALYRNLQGNAEFTAIMAGYGYTGAKLGLESALVSKVRELRQAQIKETGEAQRATQDRDASMVALDAWLADFRAVTKVALADSSQDLEKLGILARR